MRPAILIYHDCYRLYSGYIPVEHTFLKKHFDNVTVSSTAGIYDQNELSWEEWAMDFLFTGYYCYFY